MDEVTVTFRVTESQAQELYRELLGAQTPIGREVRALAAEARGQLRAKKVCNCTTTNPVPQIKCPVHGWR